MHARRCTVYHAALDCAATLYIYLFNFLSALLCCCDLVRQDALQFVSNGNAMCQNYRILSFVYRESEF